MLTFLMVPTVYRVAPEGPEIERPGSKDMCGIAMPRRSQVAATEAAMDSVTSAMERGRSASV